MFEFLKKRPRTARVEPAGIELVVKPGEKLLSAALEAGLAWPHDCRVGSCGRCRCVLESGQVKRLTDFSYTLEFEDLQSGAILACQSVLKSDVTVSVDLEDTADARPIEHHDGQIVELARLTHDILEVVVEADRPCFVNARAGQYVDVSVSGIDAPRSYSFARSPRAETAGRVRFFIRHVPGGAFTDWLFGDDRTGAKLQLAGPYGEFHRRDASGSMLCVAGGSGLAPIKALLEEALADGVEREARVYFGARTQADLYALEAIEGIARDWPSRCVFVPVLSEEPADSDWAGRRGLVTEALASDLAAEPAGGDAEAYLCGPPPMVDAAIATLSEAGLDESVIFFDKFLDASTMPGGRF